MTQPEAIVYRRDLEGADWSALKEALAADGFDSGRTPEQLARSFANSAYIVLAYDRGRIVGTARALVEDADNAYIADVWTSRAFRRRGIGSHMLRMLMDALPGHRIALAGDSAPEFYRALGMVQCGAAFERAAVKTATA